MSSTGGSLGSGGSVDHKAGAPRTRCLAARYLLGAVRAKSRCGDVFNAVDLDSGQHVAVTVAPKGMPGSPERCARLFREAAILSTALSSRLLRFLDAGEDDTCVYLVAERLDGLPGAMLPPPAVPALARTLTRTLAYFQEIVRAVAEVHGDGLLHLDLCPESVFLASDGVCKLLDVGGAVPIGDHGTIPPGLGLYVSVGSYGTAPAYLAPERLTGPASRAPTAAADVFSLGLILHEFVAGRNAMLAFWEAAAKHPARGDLALPSGRLPEGLARVIEDATRRDPTRRISSARELLHRIARVETG